MPILRTDIERALDEIASQEEGMRFQGLAVVLGKRRWPELIACERKNDLGLDAYAPASLTPENIGKGLSASITPTLGKISGDAKTAKENFFDLTTLLFVTSAKVINPKQRQWKKAIQEDHGLELHIIAREDIVIEMMMPENASLCASFLNIANPAEPQVVDLVDRTKRAADAVTRAWADKMKGNPLIDLIAVRLDLNGAESTEVLSLEQIGQALLQSRRIVLEGSAGRGKTTTLIQLAQRMRTTGIPFIVELPAWTSSRKGILEYIAGMRAFQVEGLTPADLARVQQSEPFLLLLNGWNEIAWSNFEQADAVLRELERDFPSAGIIVATRTHHLTPPLPGALRLKLLRLRQAQRAAYLAARLGAKGDELRARIDADPSLDELTRTPFILSEVSSLFEAGVEIPPTKIGILAQVLHLHEQRDEHRNALQSVPIFGRQTDYLKALATEMTSRCAVTLLEADARAVVASVARELVNGGQIELVGAPAVLATLTAHHILERVDYPQAAFQFEHQQLQEFYAALDVRARLIDLLGDECEASGRFAADYLNDPAWAEPLRMIAEALPEITADHDRNTHAGTKLVEMALEVDLVFAGELAELCGEAVWNEVRSVVGERFRTAYAIHEGSFQQYALAAMLATGADDFCDILLPLLSGQDQQKRLGTYRIWPGFQLSSLGLDWREQVSGWSDEARADFVSELLHHRVNEEIALFAAADDCIEVKKAAASGLMWNQADDTLTRFFESIGEQTFEDIACENADLMPLALMPQTVVAMRKFIDRTADQRAILRAALKLLEIGESGLDDVIKAALTALPTDKNGKLSSYYIQPAIDYLRRADLAWTSEWVATHIAEGTLYGDEHWLPFMTAVPKGLVEKYLQRLETEDFKHANYAGMILVVSACADTEISARLFAKLRELQHKVDSEPGQRHDFEWQVIRQLEDVFRRLPDDIAVEGVLSSITYGGLQDIKVSTRLFSKISRSDVEPLSIVNNDLRARLRAYLKDSVELVLHQHDYNGEQKANLASSISQVGDPEDMADLVTLIRADIERMRRGRAAWIDGDRGPLGNGGIMTWANRHIAAVMHLDPVGADQLLIDLLVEPEYRSNVANAMAKDFVPNPVRSFGRMFRYDLLWDARKGRYKFPGDDRRRTQFSAALNGEINRLREQRQEGKPATGLNDLAKSLAIIDGQGSAAGVLDVISKPGKHDHYSCVETAEHLLMKGVIIPSTIVFALIDSFVERTSKWRQDSDRHLLCNILALCPFIDDPVAGIAKIRDMLDRWRLRGYELRGLIIALGESMSEAASNILSELVSDAQTFEQCEEDFINAFATLDTPRAREFLLGFVDPDIQVVELPRRIHREDVLITRLTDLARRSPEVSIRLRELCKLALPEFNRHILSKVMPSIGTPEAYYENLTLIDDSKPSPVPQGVWDQLERAFVERRPDGENTSVFTLHARESNELRVRLFKMAIEDEKRWKSALRLLGQIEEWRLEHGRPTGEPRHPDFVSGHSWPPN